MEPFKKINSRVIPLDMDHVDTDMIIPAQYLTKIGKQGYGEHLFKYLRDQDPHFVFNDPQYKESKILVSGHNFGCGSSREHAVWAITQAGVQVIIAKSYSDIFFSNAAKNGLLLIVLESAIIDSLLQHASVDIEVDLNKQTVSIADGKCHCFDYDPFRKSCFLNGQDDMAYLLEATK